MREDAEHAAVDRIEAALDRITAALLIVAQTQLANGNVALEEWRIINTSIADLNREMVHT